MTKQWCIGSVQGIKRLCIIFIKSYIDLIFLHLIFKILIYYIFNGCEDNSTPKKRKQETWIMQMNMSVLAQKNYKNTKGGLKLL